MGEIEGRPAVDFVVVLPVVGREHLFVSNTLADAADADAFHLVEGHLAKPCSFPPPVDVWMAMRHRDQQVERAHATRGERRIGDAGVLHVHRRIAAEHVPMLDVGEVVAVVFRQVDVVVGHVVVAAVDAEIEHERGAGKPPRGNLAVAPAASQPVGHEPRHAPREVGIDHRRIGGVAAARGVHRGDPSACEFERLDRLLVADLHAHVLREPGHRRRHGTAAADRMVDAVLVLQERQDREQAGTAKRRHAEILRLKREGQPDPFVGKEGAEFRVEALPRLEQRHQLDEVGGGEVHPALERLFEEGSEPGELFARGGHEPRKRARVGGREP